MLPLRFSPSFKNAVKLKAFCSYFFVFRLLNILSPHWALWGFSTILALGLFVCLFVCLQTSSFPKHANTHLLFLTAPLLALFPLAHTTCVLRLEGAMLKSLLGMDGCQKAKALHSHFEFVLGDAGVSQNNSSHWGQRSLKDWGKLQPVKVGWQCCLV